MKHACRDETMLGSPTAPPVLIGLTFDTSRGFDC